MANYIEELDQLAAQNETNPGGPGSNERFRNAVYEIRTRGPLQDRWLSSRADLWLKTRRERMAPDELANWERRKAEADQRLGGLRSPYTPAGQRQLAGLPPVDMSAGPQAGPVDQPMDRPWYPSDSGPQSFGNAPLFYTTDGALADAGNLSGVTMASGVVDPAQAVLQGAQQTAGMAAVTPQGTTTATTGTAPGTPEERAPRQRGGVTWSAPGATEAFTQEDFYPNPQDPAQYGYSTGLEVVARPGRMPMGAISKAANILNNRQVELDQKRQAFAAEFSKVPKTADPYQQNFTRLVQERNNEFVQGIADAMYGGNVNKAYRAIATNPELQARWRDMNAKNEALAAHGLYNFKRAEDYLTKAATNKIASTPEARQLAKDILYGMGRYAGGGGVGGNFDKLVNDMTQFDMMLGRDEYFKDVVAPSVDKFAKQISLSVDETGKPLMVYDKGRYVFFTEGSKKSFDTQIEQFAKDMAISQGYGSGESLEQKVADNVEYLKNMLPSQVETRTQVIDKYRGLGGGGGGGGAKTGTTFKYQPLKGAEAVDGQLQITPLIQKAKQAGANITSDPNKAYAIDAIQFFELSAGKSRMPAIQTIQQEAVIPVGILRDKNGNIFLYGKKARYTGAKTQDDEDLLDGLFDESGNVNITKFNNLEDAVFPYNMARSVISSVGGFDSQEMASSAIDQERARAGFGQRQFETRQSRPAAAASKPVSEMSPEEYEQYLNSL